ncbi:tRNA pseudouridine(13) synthase TruD [Candidatus Thiodiazotropha sp. CDECU1]|uniref:tRNA pseudouridine(13) synthase TruD n=1 Tax=Candidatus Thiodiazotropha sp. CDECU1 TaxID=3065865 RepID=UPI00292F1999|nr:tRNA pseudouridine(13) synthase TruD [Candidatus Thiodiazotropha sp. CDECU1]
MTTDTPWQPLESMPRVCGNSPGSGVIRAFPEDFQVDEVLGFEADGDGEHLLLHIKKRQTNTHWLAGQLAGLAGIPAKDVSYAGMKDRHAVTTQWFSLRMAGRPEPDWGQLDNDLIQVLQVQRHRRKLRRGALRGNRFQIRIRDLSADRAELEQGLIQLRDSGMPNYFGEQRFGHDYQNLALAEQLFSQPRSSMKRQLRGLVISAVRSQFFNQVLAERIRQGNWNQPLAGDYFNLDGSRSGFAHDQAENAELSRRCGLQDIHPSGPLWGRGLPLVNGLAGELEARVLSGFESWRYGLEHVGLEQERRPLRVRLQDLIWGFPEDGCLEVRFFLPAGCFATAMLREIIEY